MGGLESFFWSYRCMVWFKCDPWYTTHIDFFLSCLVLFSFFYMCLNHPYFLSSFCCIWYNLLSSSRTLGPTVYLCLSHPPWVRNFFSAVSCNCMSPFLFLFSFFSLLFMIPLPHPFPLFCEKETECSSYRKKSRTTKLFIISSCFLGREAGRQAWEIYCLVFFIPGFQESDTFLPSFVSTCTCSGSGTGTEYTLTTTLHLFIHAMAGNWNWDWERDGTGGWRNGV